MRGAGQGGFSLQPAKAFPAWLTDALQLCNLLHSHFPTCHPKISCRQESTRPLHRFTGQRGAEGILGEAEKPRNLPPLRKPSRDPCV